jgi:spore germination protein KC
MGLDKTADGYLLTEQIINPKAVAAKNPTDSAPVTLYTSQSSNIEVAINNLLLKSSRLIYNTHLRLVVLGEELAREG